MASAYELAFLSNFVYDSNEGQATRIFEIPFHRTGGFSPVFLDPQSINSSDPNKSIWAISRDVGLTNHMYAATFENMQTHERVYAFRGTRINNFWGAVADIATDALHLIVRRSPYISAARRYISADNHANSIITGHSLGGYLAISMAFYFRNKKIATFNAPTTTGYVGKILDVAESTLGRNFTSNKIICYNSETDFASKVTSFFGLANLPHSNMRFEDIPNAGWHTMEPMLRQLRRRGRRQIRWRRRRN